jgi:hypothetical protein
MTALSNPDSRAGASVERTPSEASDQEEGTGTTGANPNAVLQRIFDKIEQNRRSERRVTQVATRLTENEVSLLDDMVTELGKSRSALLRLALISAFDELRVVVEEDAFNELKAKVALWSDLIEEGIQADSIKDDAEYRRVVSKALHACMWPEEALAGGVRSGSLKA